MGLYESNSIIDAGEPFESNWDDYEFKDPTISSLVLSRMITRYDGMPCLALYKNKYSDTFYIWWIDYQAFVERGIFSGVLYAITKKEMNRLLNGEEVDLVMMEQPMRTCIILEMTQEAVWHDYSPDDEYACDYGDTLVVMEDTWAKPYIDLLDEDKFPKGMKLV